MHCRFALAANLALYFALIPTSLYAQTPTLAPAVSKYVKAKAPQILLTHVRIIDGTGAAPLEDQNLVVIKGDPSTKISDIENVEIVFKDGIGYDSAKLFDSIKGRYGQY